MHSLLLLGFCGFGEAKFRTTHPSNSKIKCYYYSPVRTTLTCKGTQSIGGGLIVTPGPTEQLPPALVKSTLTSLFQFFF